MDVTDAAQAKIAEEAGVRTGILAIMIVYMNCAIIGLCSNGIRACTS